MWNVVFMGTPAFAVGSLQALLAAGVYQIQAVVTQPDRPKGRGQKLVEPPVKTFSLQHGLPVYQPLKVKEPEFVQQLKAWQPDFIVVAAFGQFLSREILDIPRYGCINVHGSLLPKYRGAAPIQYAIIKGEKETGVTIMRRKSKRTVRLPMLRCSRKRWQRSTGPVRQGRFMTWCVALILYRVLLRICLTGNC